MNPDLRTATRDAARALFSRGLMFYLIWWAVLIVVITGILIARARYFTVSTSTWHWMGNSPRIMFLVIGILLPTLFLPRWVSHGITRRAFALAGGLNMAVAAIAGGAIVATGYAVESVVYSAAGWEQALQGLPSQLFADSSAWHLIFLHFTLTYSAYAITGWLIGTGYYRWGPWRGTLFLIPALLPLVATEAVFVPGPTLGITLGVERLPALAVVVVALIITVLGGIAGYSVVRNMPLRRAAGWSM
jgi:hypothetical protein